MKRMGLMVAGLLVFATGSALAAVEATPTELACADFKPTAEAAQRFADLKGACEAIVEIDGRLYAKVRAVVRRASSSSVTLNLPATDHTFTLQPRAEGRVLVGNQKLRPRDLQRGQEISIHIPIDRFAEPNIEEVALVQDDTTSVVTHEVQEEEEAPAVLPTTASPLPLLALGGGLLLLFGAALRRRRGT
jgi:hypothetical protein